MTTAEDAVQTDLRDNGVLVICLDHPPVNALTPNLRAALMQALGQTGDQRVHAVVIAATGRNFSAASGAEPLETPPNTPTLAELCRAIEDLPLPVVVALQGAAIGPGAELALAAHARVADHTARIVFPEVGLGLVPMAGSTQRLPRLVGAREAVAMLVQARPVRTEEGLTTGLIDVMTEGDLLAEAVAYAAAMPAPRPVRDRRDGMADVPGYQAAIAAARVAAGRGVLPAAGRIIECIEAAVMLPFENGLALEAIAREDLEAGEESAALCAAALAERQAAQMVPGVAKIRAKTVAEIGLVGAAAQMPAFALMALRHGVSLRWLDDDATRRAASMAWISQRQDAAVQAGQMTQMQRDADNARVSQAAGPQDMQGCDLIVHGAAGDAVAGFARLLPAAPQLVMGGAEGAFGLSLAPSARISELALPSGAAPAHIAVAVQFLRRIGLPPVLEGKMPVIGRRVAQAGRLALIRMLEMGVPQRLLASALDGFGQALPDMADPEKVAAMPSIGGSEVVQRWHGAMANEGLRLLDAHVAARPSDIDLVMVAGYGFPRWRGGPMHQADRRGLLVLRRDLRLWSADDPALWTPHPVLDRLIADGRRLEDLNL